MKIGLIDVDGHNFPNLPLMKLSAWHKSMGDSVEWYNPLLSTHLDKVYMSKVFSFTPDYPYYIDADEIVKGGIGYCISLENGKEVYHKEKDSLLPSEIEHMYPDYSLYPALTEDTAYGFLTRGCPRCCEFCHVAEKEGKCSIKVDDLRTFWNGQKKVVLLDPNITACRDWRDLFQQLIDSRAQVDFNQGLDIRLMTEEKAEMLKRIKVSIIHFAWDKYEDKKMIVARLKHFKEVTHMDRRKLSVYILTNFNTTIEQDLERIYILRDLGYDPYVMIYNKDDYVITDKNGKPIKRKPEYELSSKYTTEQIRHFDKVWDLQGWVNNKRIFMSCTRFEEYQRVV